MAIGSHGTGRGGTVGAGRHGRRRASAKLFSLSSVFGAAVVETDLFDRRIGEQQHEDEILV